MPFPDLDGPFGPHLTGTTPGIGPHVTIAVPFPTQLTPAGADVLATVAERFEPWPVDLAELDWFRAPHEVLWIRPEPAEPFHELAAAVAEAFEGLPVYGGPDVFVPHVTMGVGTAAELEDVERRVSGLLPRRTEARELQLIEVVGGVAQTARSWPIGGRSA